MTHHEQQDRETRVHARTSQGNPPEDGLARTLSELARDLQAEPDMESLVPHVVAALVGEIDGADHGGISLVDGRTVRAIAATHAVVKQMDELQERLDEGPCLSSLRDHITVRSDDFAYEQRWPRFVDAAMDHGVRSMLSVQLFVQGDNLGALNLYASKPRAFTMSDESTAIALAAHAAVAMKGSRVEQDLRRGLASRDLIGVAKGILVERHKISGDEAFRMLVVASQSTNTKLRDVAEHLTATGELARH